MVSLIKLHTGLDNNIIDIKHISIGTLASEIALSEHSDSVFAQVG